MSKIKIKTTINDENFYCEGIKTKNNIIYKDNNVSVKIIFSDIIKIIRENNEYRIELNFNKNEKTRVNYLLKEYNKSLELNLVTKNININNNYIEILYEIIDNNEGNINFKLEFEEIL